MADGKDPLGAYHFSLDVQGIETATFTDASGFDNETQIIEYRDVDKDGKIYIRKTFGGTKWADIVLKRGTTGDNSLFTWRQAVLDGNYDSARKDGTITGRDPTGKAVIQFNFKRGWISKYQGPSYSAKGNDVAVESITITHEGLERTL